MRLLYSGPDGGSESGVRGFWLIEIKPLFSIVLLRFDRDHREVYHSHAFSALTWWLRGEVTEMVQGGPAKRWRPSLIPKFTPRSCCHKVDPVRRTWALSIRGPWTSRWTEYNPKTQQTVTLTKHRQVVGV